ncbi:putative carbohydrate sulfotransferase 15 [Apostichopus japonicus]|uniref:Putative carbohydrate sulfotransferase 15 n=1 Tax=Stichopus japonicus TaxID=307972 RepID=A0A2G8L3J9_STIJA|nr:putative carbohydrate sulfotransferase 15 [Apostichopus japonicus]
MRTPELQINITREHYGHTHDGSIERVADEPLNQKSNIANDWRQDNHVVTMTGNLLSSADNDIKVKKQPARNPTAYDENKESVSNRGNSERDNPEESPGHNGHSNSQHRKSRFGFRGEDVVVWKKLENGTIVKVEQTGNDRFFNNEILRSNDPYVHYLSRFNNLTISGLRRKQSAVSTLQRLHDRNVSSKTKIAEWKAFDDNLKHHAATKAIKWDQEWLEDFAGKEMIELMDLTIVGKGVIPMRLKEFELKPSMTGKSLEDLRNKIKQELLRMNEMQPAKPVTYDRKNLPIELYNLAPYLFDKIPRTFSSSTKNPCWENPELSFRVLCLPYFYLIGAPKSATTDLWSKIVFHPDVMKSLDKEPQFWTRGNLVRGLLKYCANFMPLSNAITRNEHTLSSLITGDGTASNFWERRRSQMLYGQPPDGPPYFTADMIRAVQPNARIIVIIREPASRLYSEYLDLDSFWPLFKSPEDFHVRVEDVIGHFNKCLETKHIAGCASNYYQPRLQVGMYSVHIREWMKRFPPEQILVLRTEEWARQPTLELQKVYKFLNLTEISSDAIESFTSKGRKNQRKPNNQRVGEMLPETRTLLNSFYQPFNEDLANVLKDDK